MCAKSDCVCMQFEIQVNSVFLLISLKVVYKNKKHKLEMTMTSTDGMPHKEIAKYICYNVTRIIFQCS